MRRILPGMDSPDLVRLVNRLGGVATRAQLLEACHADDLAGALQAGDLRRIARGRYSTHDTAAGRVAARSVSGVLSGLSAAQHWGWAVKKAPKQPIVTVPRNRAVTRAGLTIRREDLPATAVVDGFVLSRAATVVDCARTLPFDEALSVADSALDDIKVSRDEILGAAHSSPRSGRARAIRVVERASPDAANPFESCVRAVALDVPGLSVVPQGQVDNVGWADLVDYQLKIVIECDSWEFHSSPDAFSNDVRRYTRMICGGWLVVRFVWEDAMHRQERIRSALDAVVAIRREQG